MAWRIAFDEQTRCIRLDFEGRVTEADVQASNAAARALFVEKGTRCIVSDLTGVTSLALTTLDIFKHAQDAQGDMREAVVCPNGNPARQAVLFYETVCRNRGKKVRAFEALQPALAWVAAAG